MAHTQDNLVVQPAGITKMPMIAIDQSGLIGQYRPNDDATGRNGYPVGQSCRLAVVGQIRTRDNKL